jgi:uncharacterized membrane protein
MAHLASQRGGIPPYTAPGALPVLLQTQQTVVWQGQYPPPDAIERYEKILPGSFDRMIRMAEQLQSAQIKEAESAQNYTQKDTKRGHWLGWSLSVIAIVGALGCLWLNYPWVAPAFLSLPVLAVAKALVESVKSQSSANVATTTIAPPPPDTPQPASALDNSTS